MLIGISCGGAAIFFISLSCIIFYCRNLKEREFLFSDDFSISDDEVIIIAKDKIDNNDAHNNNQKIDHKSSEQNNLTDLDFWV